MENGLTALLSISATVAPTKQTAIGNTQSLGKIADKLLQIKTLPFGGMLSLPTQKSAVFFAGFMYYAGATFAGCGVVLANVAFSLPKLVEMSPQSFVGGELISALGAVVCLYNGVKITRAYRAAYSND